MRIYVTSQLPGGQSMAVVEHRNQQLMWNVAAYAKTSERATTVDIDRMFDEINAYWLTVDDKTLDAIWNVYVRIRAVMDSFATYDVTNRQLRHLIAELYSHISLDNIQYWMLFHSKVRMPGGLKETYAPNDPIERTYLKDDYYRLAALAIALRPMVPIWGEYLLTSKEPAGANFKEYMALSLLMESHLDQSEALQKLEAYVRHTVESIKQSQGTVMTAIIGGLSTEEIPRWVLAVTVARRLAVGEVSSQTDTSTVISNVFNFILSTWRSVDKKIGKGFGGKVSEKKHYSEGGEEDKTSHVENYKVKQQVPDGDLVTLEVYTENMYAMAQHAAPDVPEDYIRQCYDAVQVLSQGEIATELITLTQWVLAVSLPARGIPSLPKPAMLRAMAVAQAILWHWKFYDLAALVTATKIQLPGDMYVSATGGRQAIPKELQQQLTDLFPYTRRARSKQENIRKLNPAYRAIDEFCDNITNNDWYILAPDPLLQLCAREGNSRRMSIPVDVRAQLAQLVIHLADKDKGYLSP